MARRFRPLPKTLAGTIDKEKVKEQYLDGADYVWSDFCKKYNYNPDLRREFPISSLHREWILKKSELQAELFTAGALELQSIILQQRVEVLKVQAETNRRLRGQLSRTLATAEISKTPLSPRELVMLVNAQKGIQSCEFEALLMTAQSSKEPLELNSSHIQSNEDHEGERLRSIPTVLMSGEGLTADKMNEILEKWIDQSETNAARRGLEELKEHSDSNVPLDSLDP
jgi:hypothetical protein